MDIANDSFTKFDYIIGKMKKQYIIVLKSYKKNEYLLRIGGILLP